MKHLLKCSAVAAVAILCPSPTAENLLERVPDGRAAKLEAFFKSYQCPQPYYVEEYLRAADKFAIDYRLLPALSVRESTCGEYDRLNNRWGWDSAQSGFPSVQSGIAFVIARLAQSANYQGKTIHQKLRTYNPNPPYPKEVEQLMREIDPAAEPAEPLPDGRYRCLP